MGFPYISILKQDDLSSECALFSIINPRKFQNSKDHSKKFWATKTWLCCVRFLTSGWIFHDIAALYGDDEWKREKITAIIDKFSERAARDATSSLAIVAVKSVFSVVGEILGDISDVSFLCRPSVVQPAG